MKKFFLIIPFLFIFIHLLANTDGPNAWTQDLSVTGLGIWNDCIQINSQNPAIMYAAANGVGIYKSTNYGVNWTLSNTGLSNLVVWALTISKSNPNMLICGTTDQGSSPGIYVSTDAANTWVSSNTGITGDPIGVQSIVIDPINPNIVYVSLFSGGADATTGLWKSTTGGSSWFASNTGIGSIKNILSIAMNPKNNNVLYCGTSFNFAASTGPVHIYKTVNAAALWTDMSVGLPPLTTDIDPVRCLSISDVDTTVVLAALFQNTTAGGAFLSTNGGGSWTRIQNSILPTLAANQMRAAVIRPGSSTEFFVGLDGSAPAPPSGVYRTTNRGVTWTDFNGGPVSTTSVTRALKFRTTGPGDSTLFCGVAGTSGMGVYEYSFFPVGITNQNEKIPKDFALHQNYPNPFNPTTLIIYDIPKEANVSLNVYDVSGRLVKNLVNENEKAGTFYLNFDASSLSSGVYFYKLIAGSYISTKKMILVK
jgi:hypothetical protein